MIGIVTVLYNSAPVLEEYFSTLDIQTYKVFILYVIDNKSSDNSLAEAERLSETVGFKTIILPQPENWGVAKGNNIGIKAALKDKCDYVLLSNNDVVLEKDTIENLLKGHIDNNASLSVPKIYYWNTDKIIWAAGGYFRLTDCSSRHYGMRKPDQGQFDKVRQIGYAPTCFMLINKSVFNDVGFMDETYFVYYDDSDFIWRAVRKDRGKVYYIPSSLLWHKESFSTGGSQSDFSIYYLARNRMYFAHKHFNFLQRVRLYMFLAFHYITRDLKLLTKDQRNLLKKGLADGKALSKSTLGL
ncbi:hypothetical protein SAMN04487902_101383 [Prevotella sp. ne3005]|uniref:glycosyltransferase family 2 protein n=1 Tax=Prevotella sp. ne3005 TaxID=1761887 RepID=UPI0008CCF7A3|nr:glycosyltransferase family 2 protein [Prevotella sp. ne3005]SEM54348.1 hypothetical protein SAMN04487902_101383 [Prevotella sp. ne3005]